MSQAIIPLKGSGLPTLTTKTVARNKKNNRTGEIEKEKQNYIDRVRGYIPVEVVAFFVFVNSLITDNVFVRDANDEFIRNISSLTADGYVAIIATIFGVVGTIVYMEMTAKDSGLVTWKFSASMAVVAFLIWIYAMDAKIIDVLNFGVVPSVSGLLLASFTLFVGIVVPTSKEGIENHGELL